ncbi:response regulator [Flavobacterium seoulense]|uniref:histidine kinase n=1 Tax=Flavobacterium seoulense TaxID=1492738 RepID=A0A066WR15_9FLAO|nr:response regulator [Flavobacterium seoulense]KDN56261.1 histidine kinase [Flavobacterium seoulense]
MYTSHLNRNLKRQITKFLSDEIIENNSQLKDFINAVNQTYLNYEKDAELFEQSAKLNDKEFMEINNKVKKELAQKELYQKQIIDSIYTLSGVDIQLVSEKDILGLIDLLNEEIRFKKIYQDQLLLAKAAAEKANEAKSDFLSIMSHEIRTPLNAIIGLIYIMEKEGTIESFRENIDVLKYSSNNLFLLINNILDFSKIEAGKITIEKIAFNFKDFINQIGKSSELKASENLNKIEVQFDDNFVPNIISDPLRLSQIMNNLVSNATKFTKNGIIKIQVDQISVVDGISTFKIQVQDSGIGIDITKFNLIFEKFAQAETKTSREFGGTGLGLVITKKLLQLLGSDIHLESEIGKGSNFSFILQVPIDNKTQNMNNGIYDNDYEVKNMKGLKLLLVEDNVINVKIASKIINQWEVDIDVAENGQVAIEKFNSNPYDIILMDLSMPIMDGYEATKIIREKNTSIPIVALTAAASDDFLDGRKDVGFNEYIVKPFNPRELNMRLFEYFKVLES